MTCPICPLSNYALGFAGLILVLAVLSALGVVWIVKKLGPLDRIAPERRARNAFVEDYDTWGS